MSVIDDILAKPPETRTVEFCLDRELAERLFEAQRHQKEREDALAEVERRRDRTGVEEAAARLDDARATVETLAAEVRTKLVRFTFEAVDPEQFDRLKADHRPTEQKRTEAKKLGQPLPEWNEDTFSPALVAASCVKVESPAGVQDGLSIEDAQRLWKVRNYNQADRAELFHGALSAYLMRTRLDLPKAGSASTDS